MEVLKGSPVEEESNTFVHYTFHSEYLVISIAEEMHPEQFICSSFFPLNIKAIFLKNVFNWNRITTTPP